MKFAVLAIAAATLSLAGAASAQETPQRICESETSAQRYTPQQQIQACTTLITDYGLSGHELAAMHYNRGRAWYDAGNQANAIADYTQAIRIDPAYAAALYNRGTSYNATRQFPAAIADFTEAIRLNPGYTNAYFNRAAAHANSGDYARAVEDFSAVIRLNPNMAVAWRNRSIAYRRMGDTDRADADAAQAAQLGQ